METLANKVILLYFGDDTNFLFRTWGSGPTSRRRSTATWSSSRLSTPTKPTPTTSSICPSTRWKTLSSNLWWSDFNSISGNYYQTSSLPPLILPKNLAMVISRDLVKYVAQNGNYLRSFASLLTSLGLWFSCLDRKLVNDHQWSKKLPSNAKDFRVDNSVLAFQGVSPKAMRQVWKQNLPMAMTNSNNK